MKESKKVYELAVKYFHKGDLEKALEYLEKAIAIDMKNSAALNLKGMIFYIKGDGKKAETTWRINIDFNDDEIAKSYIKSYQKDLRNQNKYNEALEKIKAVKIAEAVECLEFLTASDYNSINVGNALTYCYIKQRKFSLAKHNVLKVLDKDCKNKIAKDNLEIIYKETGEKKPPNNKKLIAIVTCITIGVAGSFMFLNKSSSLENDKLANVSTEKNDENVVDKNNSDKNSTETVDKKELNVNELQKTVDKNDYMGISELIKGISGESLTADEKVLFDKANEIMKLDGVNYLYEKAVDEFKTKNFGEAIDIFLKSYEYAKGIYLEEHVNYMMAVSYENLSDIENALKYYEIYANKDYKKDEGGYIEEVLYKLATLSKGEKSVEFAKRLKNEFKDSMYNNQNIDKILNQ